jgi:SAM-dependent methyltransferase
VLDVATGTGYLALTAAAIGHRVTGIDLAEPMLAEARAATLRRGLTAAFMEGDAVTPPFEAGSFDAITNRHFLWTLREPEVAFRNWLRLLRPGGRVVAIDGFWFLEAPDGGDGPNPFDDHYTEETRAALPVMNMRSPEPVAAMFREAGFGEVTIGDLAAVHALAEEPPGAEPWYVILARTIAGGRTFGVVLR